LRASARATYGRIMKYRAVVFDLDGTLLDTIEDLTDSMNVALEALGAPARTPEECKLFVGDGMENYARRALPEGRRDQAAISRCIELIRADYAGRWTSKTRPYEGIVEMLSALDAAELPMAVLSNKPDDFTRRMVAHFFGRQRFRAVRGARDDVPKKPDPAGAMEIASQLGIPPGGFLYLGDTNTDMRTANAAGMFAVGATWGFRPAEELTANGAEALIDRPRQLLTLLK